MLIPNPHFHDITHFLSMGGYAIYIWPAYGICAVVLLFQVIKAKLSARE